MRKIGLWILVVSLCLYLVPTTAQASAAVVQDSCTIAFGHEPVLRTHFTVVNFDLPVEICGVYFIPEPQPPLEACIMVGCARAQGWSCFLDPPGGTQFFANTAMDCIAPGTARGGFAFFIGGEVCHGSPFCCYVVRFVDATGAVILEQEECFTCGFICGPLPVERTTWGRIKSLYE